VKHPGPPPDALGALALLGLELDRDQLHRLAAYERLLREHAPRLGLIAEGDLPRLLERHVLDSLRAAPVLEGEEVCDLGSGAGLPGIPLAIALPHATFVLCEPKRRRVGFLELALERLGLANASVAPVRAEELPAESADTATARAFADYEDAWRTACPILRRGGRLVYFAGRAWRRPAGGAPSITGPERPASLETSEVLEKEPPLVIMTRR
jgi:16S rRNA (guanine527-N7)-methyltransferase